MAIIPQRKGNVILLQGKKTCGCYTASIEWQTKVLPFQQMTVNFLGSRNPEILKQLVENDKVYNTAKISQLRQKQREGLHLKR